MDQDFADIPFTIVTQFDHHESVGPAGEELVSEWEHTMEDNQYIEIKVDNVLLEQEPFERLNLKLIIFCVRNDQHHPYGQVLMKSLGDGDRNSYLAKYYYNYQIEMEFSNYVHEFNGNYSYEVMCKMVADDQHLFRFMDKRTSKRIFRDNLFFMQNSRNLFDKDVSPLFYFCIRRINNDFKSKSDLEKRRRDVLYTIISVGYCDVVLETKNGVVHAHRSILSHNSEVFNAMFSNEMVESQTGFIKMDEHEKEVVVMMLNYMYTGTLDEDPGDLTKELYALAHYYQLHNLCSLCLEYYVFRISSDSEVVFDILELAQFYDLHELDKLATAFLKTHPDELIKLPRYQDDLMNAIGPTTVLHTMSLACRFDIEPIKKSALKYIKDNYSAMMQNPDFLKIFESCNPILREFIPNLCSMSTLIRTPKKRKSVKRLNKN